jgi:hypothetical protein
MDHILRGARALVASPMSSGGGGSSTGRGVAGPQGGLNSARSDHDGSGGGAFAAQGASPRLSKSYSDGGVLNPSSGNDSASAGGSGPGSRASSPRRDYEYDRTATSTPPAQLELPSAAATPASSAAGGPQQRLLMTYGAATGTGTGGVIASGQGQREHPFEGLARRSSGGAALLIPPGEFG